MARFRFRLETVLRLRLRAEQEAARAAARCEGLLLAAERERETLLAARHQLLLHRDGLQRHRVEPARLRENHYQIVAVERALPGADRRLALRLRELQVARAALTERSRDRKLLEKLAERQLAEQRALEAGRERRELDERPLPRHGMAIALRPLSADGR
jgi:flagellar FliJ protein